MKKLLFSALVGAMIISCSRDNDNTNPTTPQTPATSETTILPIKSTYYSNDSSPDTTIFTYSGNILLNTTYGVLSYTDHLITSYKEDDINQFKYDNRGNLISEIYIDYDISNYKFNNGKTREYSIIYTIINNSTIKAEKIYKNYRMIDGNLSSTTISNITYTLDGQKRPIKIVEESKEIDSDTNVIISKTISTDTYMYANHNSTIKNIKGFDKLSYSNFLKDNDYYFTNNISYHKKEETKVVYSGKSPLSEYNVKEETKYEYILNHNGYPTKIQKYYKGSIDTWKEQNYVIIEYNK